MLSGMNLQDPAALMELARNPLVLLLTTGGLWC
jgi:hypothetical protein